VNATAASPRSKMELDFRLACADLAHAKAALRDKDTPVARARLRTCAATVDAILDLSNEAADRAG
jgi:hypothetical protein